MHADDISEGLVAVGSNVGLSLIIGTNLAIYTNVQYIGCMLASHRIALDPTNKQKTLLRQHEGYARFVWNWGVAECRRALDAGESSATYHQRFSSVVQRGQGRAGAVVERA